MQKNTTSRLLQSKKMTFGEWAKNSKWDFDSSDYAKEIKEIAKAAWEAAQPKWQPIEDAPKNRRVLLTNGELIATGRYRLPTIFDTKKEFCYDSGLTKSDATHWMPMPPSPEERVR